MEMSTHLVHFQYTCKHQFRYAYYKLHLSDPVAMASLFYLDLLPIYFIIKFYSKGVLNLSKRNGSMLNSLNLQNDNVV